MNRTESFARAPSSRFTEHRPQRIFFLKQRDFRELCRSLALILLGAVVLGSCARTVVPPAPVAAPPVAPPPPATALVAGVAAGPAIASLGINAVQAVEALKAFRISCPSVVKRTDASGLTRGEDWRAACDAAASWPDANAAAFFEAHFEAAEVGEGKAFLTGYFEPQIAGSRTQMPGYVPVYRKPPDLIDADAAAIAAGATIKRGRMENGVLVPYYERAEIEDGALAGKGLEIAWAADAIEFFFLQIQGSGRLLLPDGGVIRIGYAAQNGREYVGIGKLMKDRGLLGPGQTSMQGIVAWLRAHPEEGRAVMRENKSYIFFQELTGPGPLGSLGLPVTPRATVATDPKFVPLGAPVLLSVDRPEANGVWIAQDTGGAIKGPNRFDTFWGAGAEAATIAGGMQARGKAYILLPKGIVARLNAAAGA
jgi:membrane-bound lytic murein transglycosylase A